MGVITDMRMGEVPVVVISIFGLILFHQVTAKIDQCIVHPETLLRTNSSWDGEPYKSYPSGQPELSMMKITLVLYTQLEWHSHPMPSAAYVVSGELTLERQRDGKKQHFTAGQAVAETVDTFHRGMAGNEPVVLIVFYAGSAGLSLTQHPCR